MLNIKPIFDKVWLIHTLTIIDWSTQPGGKKAGNGCHLYCQSVQWGNGKNGKMKQKHESGKNAHTHSGERLSSGDD